jgi:hypothetical protein
MSNILALDPGTTETGWVSISGMEIINMGITPNAEMFHVMERHASPSTHFAIEMIACYGMPVGRETFETCVWIGRFIEIWKMLTMCNADTEKMFVYRREVKMYLCNSTRAKDGNVSQAIRDKFPATGGGKKPQIGTKGQPGPLYGIKSHIWAALGVALTYADKHTQR